MHSFHHSLSAVHTAGARVRLALVALAGALCASMALAVMGTATAHAEWHFSKAGAQRVAKDYVSKHYAETYAMDLTTYCRPQGQRYDPRYKYHRWVCGWYDSSDDTSGAVLIIGSSRIGAYYGRVLVGAR